MVRRFVESFNTAKTEENGNEANGSDHLLGIVCVGSA